MLLSCWAHARPAQAVEPAATGQAKIDQACAPNSTWRRLAPRFVIPDEQFDPSAVVQSAGAGPTRAGTAPGDLRCADGTGTRAAGRGCGVAHAQASTAHYLVNMIEVRGDLALAESLAPRRPGGSAPGHNP